MTTTTATAIDAETHRQLAVDLFNHTWTLLETTDRTPMQDDEMLHAAHASRHHWGVVGEPVNFARGEWQCSRVYAVLGRAEPALWHGRRCLAICEEHGIGDFDVAFAWEAIARAVRRRRATAPALKPPCNGPASSGRRSPRTTTVSCSRRTWRRSASGSPLGVAARDRVRRAVRASAQVPTSIGLERPAWRSLPG